MKKQIISLLGAVMISSCALAQSYTITLFPNSVLDANGSFLTHAAQVTQGINIFFAETESTSFDFSSEFGDPTAVGAEALASLEELTWTSMNQAGGAPNEFWVTPGWTGGSGDAIAGTPGGTVLVAFTTASTVGGTVDGDDIALLASNVLVPGLGQSNMQFGTQFDVIAGVAGSGSVQMITTVPEPSTFAAFAGFLALGCVALRRRK